MLYRCKKRTQKYTPGKLFERNIVINRAFICPALYIQHQQQQQYLFRLQNLHVMDPDPITEELKIGKAYNYLRLGYQFEQLKFNAG